MSFPPLAELMPQTAPMLLLDEVLSFEASRISCSVELNERDPFMNGGRVRAAVCLEYMAQAIAAHTGLVQRERGEPPRPGYIISVRSLSLNRSYLHAGDRLTVNATLILSDANTSTFEASIDHAGEQVAKGEISVFQPPSNAELK